jgi:hypothetical protein
MLRLESTQARLERRNLFLDLIKPAAQGGDVVIRACRARRQQEGEDRAAADCRMRPIRQGHGCA